MTNGIYTDADLRLNLQLYEGEVTLLEYAEQSAEYREAFWQYCQENGLPTDDRAANRFLDWLLKQEEKAHTDMLD